MFFGAFNIFRKYTLLTFLVFHVNFTFESLATQTTMVWILPSITLKGVSCHRKHTDMDSL